MRVHAIGRSLAVMVMALALPAAARAQTQVYALESGRYPLQCSAGGCHGPTVHLINAATGHELASIVTGSVSQKGTSIQLSSNGATLFVTSTSHTLPSNTPPTSPGLLTIVDAIGRVVLAQVTVGVGAADVAITQDSSRAYVVNTSDNSVSVVDLSSFTVVATIPVQTAPARIVAAPNGNAMYVTNTGSNSVSTISVTSNTVETTIGVGGSPVGLDISADGSRLFVANGADGTVTVIDAALDSALRVIPAGTGQLVDVSAQSATRVFVAAAGTGPNGSGSVRLLNAADGAELGAAGFFVSARFARDSSGSATYLVENVVTPGAALRSVAADGTSATTLATANNWNAAAVLTDPCAFEATANTAVFGPSGGTGVLTIPAPPGCAWTIDASGFTDFGLTGTLSGTGSAARSYAATAVNAPRLGTLAIGRQVITVEQTIPRMNIDFPAAGAVLQQPLHAGRVGDRSNTRFPPAPIGLFRARRRLSSCLGLPAAEERPSSPAARSVRRPSDVAALFGANMNLSDSGSPSRRWRRAITRWWSSRTARSRTPSATCTQST